MALIDELHISDAQPHVGADAYQRGRYASNVFGVRPSSRAPLNAALCLLNLAAEIRFLAANVGVRVRFASAIVRALQPPALYASFLRKGTGEHSSRRGVRETLCHSPTQYALLSQPVAETRQGVAFSTATSSVLRRRAAFHPINRSRARAVVPAGTAFRSRYAYASCRVRQFSWGRGHSYSRKDSTPWKRPCITNKVRSCERSDPRSEPFVGRARSLRLGQPTENIYLGEIPNATFGRKNCAPPGVCRYRCSSRRPILALAQQLCPDSRQTALSIWRPRSPVTSQGLIKESPLAKWGEVKIVNPVARFPPHFLRVAASSNPAFERTRISVGGLPVMVSVHMRCRARRSTLR